MRRGEDGWRLAAGSLCFPSSWSLDEKFGRPLQEIHAPVPGFGPRHPHRRSHPPHVRQSRRRAAGRAAQLVDPGRRRRSTSHCPTSPASTARRPAFALSRKATSPPTPSSASSARRCANCPYRATSCSPSASISTRCRCWQTASRPRQRSPPPSPRSLRRWTTAQLDYKGLTADRDRLVARLTGDGGEPRRRR